MAASRGGGGPDALTQKLLATQPPQPRQKRGRRRRFTGRDRLKIGAVVLAIIAFAVYANFFTPDTSSIAGLDVGDCFEAPDGRRIKRLTIQDCALPHEGQVIAEANGLRDDAGDKCADAFARLDPQRLLTLPSDARFGVLNATISHRCVVTSPSGQLTQSLTGP